MYNYNGNNQINLFNTDFFNLTDKEFNENYKNVDYNNLVKIKEMDQNNIINKNN
jgi:hypothetical protein